MSFNWKKVLSLVMALAMILSFVPTNFAHAEESETTQVEVDTLDELQAALADNSNNLPIVVTASIVIPAGVTAVLDLNGKTVTGLDNVTYGDLAVAGTASLTITDSSTSANGKFDGVLLNYGTLTIAGGTVTSDSSSAEGIGGTIVCQPDDQGNLPVLNITGGTVSYTGNAMLGMAISAVNTNDRVSELNISGGTITSTGACVIAQATGSITGGTFTGKDLTDFGVKNITLSGGAAITGGTFNTDVSAYLAAGYKLDENGTVVKETPAAPTGTLGKGYISLDPATEGRYRVYAEILNVSAQTSIELKLYSGETLIGSTALNSEKYVFPYTSDALGMNMVISGNASSSWNTVWEEGMLRADLVPDTLVLYLDGEYAATSQVVVGNIDDLGTPLVWAEIPGVTPAPVAPANYVAMIGENGYETLQAAIDAAYAAGGEVTITLVDNVTENVTVTEKVGLYLTIDGADKTMNGTVTVEALSDTNDNRRTTIQKVNFVNSADTGVDFITSNETNHYPRLSVLNCSFTGNGKASDVAVRTKSAYDMIIKDCTGTGLHSFLQNTAGVKVTIRNVTVTGSKGGLALGTAQNVEVRGCSLTTDTYGIRLDAVLDTSVTLNGNIVNAYIPVSVRKATANEYKVTLSGSASSYTATNPDDVWMAICATEYEDGVALNAPTGNVKLTDYTNALDLSKVYGAYEYPVIAVYSDGYTKGFDSLTSAMNYGYSGGSQVKIIVNKDITESMSSLSGNIVTENPNGVTIKNTIVDEWIYCSDDFTIGEGVTYDATGYASGLFVYAKNAVINGTVLTDCYYQRYADTKLTINEPGSMTVKTETFILRYTDGDADAGIYIVGDNNDETVGLTASVIYFYQGCINAKDADIKVGTYWQTQGTDNAGSANLILDNTNMTVTVNEHNFKATGNSTVTLKNDSHVTVAGGYEGVDVSKDATSTFTVGRGEVNFAPTPVAMIGETGYATLAEAVAAVQEGETITILTGTISEGTIKLPAALTNVTFKGETGAVLKDMTIMAADGNAISYVGLTFDGITFDNSRISLTGWRTGGTTIEDLTVTNCTFKNLNDTTNSAPVHINVDASEAVKNFTFTNNVIDGATGGSKSGVYAQLTGKVTFTGNTINNVAFRPYVIQITTDDGVADEFIVTGNTFSGSAAGRAQGLGNNAEGTDSVKLVVSGNIFKGITSSQQICYWNFNPETTTADLSKNYYDIDIAANPNKIYYNSAAADVADLIEMGVYPYYADEAMTELVTAPPIMVTYPVGNPVYPEGKVEYYDNMLAAVPYTTNCPRLEGATITLLADVSGAGLRFMENGMVFNLNGHTYTITAGTGSQGTNTSGFQIRPEVTTNVIFKNGTIKVAEGAPVVWMFNCYATDFVVEDVTVDCANMAWSYGENCYVVVSREGDNVQFTGTTKVINFKSDVAGAAINVGDTMTIGENVVPGGSIELDAGATLTAPADLDVVTVDGYKVVYENGVYTSKSTVYEVSTKAELNEALAQVEEGETILLIADIDYGTDHLKIEKPIILDLGGKTLTTKARNYGLALYNGCTVTNGKLNHAGTVAAIKVWDAKEISYLEIDVTGTSASGSTIDGIVIQENAAGVDTIKNVTVHSTSGQGVDSGIKTFNCGNATEPVIGSMENVNVDAKSIGLNVSALVGTATGCTFKGGVNGVELWIKGTYSASLTLADCDVVGGVSVHDEFNSADITNAGTITLNVDADTTGVSTETVTLTLNHAEESQVKGEVLETIIENAQAKVNGTYYLTLSAAIAAAQAGDTVYIFAGTYAVPSMKAGITVVGEVNDDGTPAVLLEGTLSGTLENLTLKNLHIKGGNAQRWAYAKGDLVFENVTFEATSVYALHFDGISAGTTLLYKDCTIIGWAAMGGSPASCTFEGCTIKGNGTYGVVRTYFDTTFTNCTFDVDNVNTSDIYQDGIHAVSGATVTANGCTNVNGGMADLVNVGDTSVIIVDDVVYRNVAKIGSNYYLTLAEAFAAAEDSDIVTLLTNIEMTESIKVAKKVTLDLNGKTISGTCGASQAYLFMVNNGATLTIKDSSDEQTGKITYAGNNSTGWIVDVEGALVLESGTLELTGTWSIGYAVDVRPNAWGTAYTAPTTFVMNGGKIVSSDGAVRVASSSSDTYNNITASFTMNGGEIEAAWDGIFVQQSNAAWDVLNVTINGGTIKSGLNPIRFYGPAATSYVNGEECVAIALNGGTLNYTGTETYEWLIDGILRVGGGVTVEQVLADCVVTASADFAAKAVPAGYKWVAAENGMYTIAACDYVAEVGGTKYESLSAAIAAANAGDTVTLLADITENVTVNKSLTIDGANFKYTGNISVSGTSSAVTVKNVNFVDGTGYAITTNRIKSITVENCTVSNYGYGFLYANKSTPTVVVKNVTVDGGNYGFHWVYGSNATLENVTMTNVTYGLYIQNYASKTITLKDCAISSIAIWERDGSSGVQTFKFEGVNTVDTLTTSQYAKFVGATIEGTNFYGDLVSMVSKAENGQTVKLLSNVTLDGSATVIESQFGYETLVYVDNKTITIDFAGFTAEVTPNAPNADKGIKGTIEGVIFVGNGAELTLKDSVGNGGIKVNAGSDLYSLIYNCESTLIIESGIYNVVETITAGSLIYADAPQTTTINGGTFTLGNASEDTESTKPWIINVEGKNVEFVLVNGGTFNQDLLMNYGSKKDCEVHIPRTLALKDNSNGTWTIVDAVAYVGNGEYNNGYATFAEAYAASDEGETVTLLKPIVVNAGETLTLDKDVKIVYTSNVVGEDMITVRGTLNISAGTVTYVNTDTTGNNVTVSTISCEPGSVLNVTRGTVENKTVYSTGSYAYAIDLLTNGNLGDVTAAISGGTVYSDYMAIRQFNNGTACENTLTISGGYVYGAKRAVQIHLDNNAAYTTISGGKIEAGEGGYSLCFFPTDATNISVTGGEFIGTVYSGTDGFISGGTFDAEPYSGYIAEGYVAYEIGEGAWGIRVANYVAEVNGAKYESLQAAIDACVAGDNTITLLADISEDVTIKQVEGVNVTIDGAGKTYSGTITIHGNARYTGAETLTIKNVKFVTSEAGHYFIDSNSTGSVERYAHNVTVDKCYFVAEGDAVNSAVAMRIRQGFNISMTRCIVEKLHSAFQGYGCAGFTAEGCQVTGKNGFSVGTSTNVKFVECAIDVTGYGIRADGTGAYDMTVQGGSIKAELPIVVRKATGAYKLTVDSKIVPKLEGTNENGYQVIFTNGDDGTYEYPTGKFEANIPDSIKVFPVPASAEIGHGLQTVVNASKPRTSVTFTLENVNAREELKVELWSGDTLLATTVLRDYDLDDTEKTSPFYPKKASTLTVNFVISGVESSSWNTVWNVTPGLSNIPDTIKVYADGELKDTYTKDGGVFLNSTELNEYIMLFAVAKIGDTYYGTFEAALDAVQDGETIELISGDKVISMTGNVVGGKTVTITGTAIVDWTKGNLFIGRGGEGDGTVIFDNANITSYAKKNPASYGIHVSGGKASDSNTNYGTLVINNSTIELDYLINRNVTEVKGNSNLTVYGGCYTHGRDASESNSGTDETATLTIEAGSTVTVINENGMGVGGEGKGVMNVNGTYKANVMNVSAKGIVNIDGQVEISGNVNNKGSIVLTAVDATMTSNECGNVTTNVDGYEVAYESGVYKLVEAVKVAEVNGVGYKTLADAIAAAQSGDTIVFLTDITEDVTVNKSVTIDGANFKYTGNISVKGSAVAVTVKNVNFVDGTGYAITTNRIKSITVENCTVSNYGYGFLYANKSTPTVVVKNVTVDGGNYGFHWVYGSNATLENVTMTNVTNGLYIQNYASKTINLKNCSISSIAIWERDGSSGVQTFKFEGANTVGTLTDSQYAKYVLTATDATLTAPEGATVTTDLEGYEVKYENGTYKVVEKVVVHITLNNDNMTLGNSLALNFWVYKNQMIEGMDYTAKLVRTRADGSTETIMVPMSDWVEYNTYYQVVYSDFAAKEMTDTVSIVILVDGVEVSNTFTDSIEEYAIYMINHYSNNTELCTALVDMLNYGAAAQKQFGYKTDDLANDQVTAAQQEQFASKSIVSSDAWSATGNGYSSNLELTDNIILRLWFKNVTDDMYAVVTFKNHYGDDVTTTVYFADFYCHNQNNNTYSVPVDELVFADLYQVVTCEMYNGEGELVGTVTESIASYLSYMIQEGRDETGLYEAAMKFANAGYNLFH